MACHMKVIDWVQFFSAFHWLPANGETSQDFGIFRQDNGIILGMPTDYTRFGDLVTIWVV